MLTGGMTIFLQRPEDFAERRLSPAVILRFADDALAVLLEWSLAVIVDDEINIYYEAARKFVQQPVRVTDVGLTDVDIDAAAEAAPSDADSWAQGESPADRRVDLVTTGPFISADSREAYRIVTVTSDLTAALGAEMHCTLADVSSTGFSVIADDDHEMGAVLPAALRYEDKQFTGTARIQSIKMLITGQIRYGLVNVEIRGEASSLAQGQQIIGAEVQRSQLSRRSGNG